MRFLVTGAGGGIGSAVLSELKMMNYIAYGVARASDSESIISVGDFANFNNWNSLLHGVDVVIHCAAQAHFKDDVKISQIKRINIGVTEDIIRACMINGVKRFVFISSIGVNGLNTNGREAFNEVESVSPGDIYCESKYMAERVIQKLSSNGVMEYVIIRPPMVYGPNLRGSFSHLKRYVCARLPLPSAAPSNRRSFIALDNLVNFIIHCSDYKKTPLAANNIFLVADDEITSTVDFMLEIRKGYGVKFASCPIPFILFKAISFLLKKDKLLNRMFDSLEIDASKARELLNWRPVRTMQEQLQRGAHNDKTI